MKYKLLKLEMINNLIEFLDEIQLEAAAEGNNPEAMQKINFCNWAISELLNAYEAYFKEEKKKPKKKSRDEFIDETFMDWNLPEMDDEDFEKLVREFDGFLKAWENEYNKDKKNIKRKKTNKNNTFKRPDLDIVSEYMSLEEIKEYLIDDPELTDNERFELYYDEHRRVQRKKQEKKEQRALNKTLKELGIKPTKK